MEDQRQVAWPLARSPDGPLLPYINDIIILLQNDGYTETTISRYIRLASDFSTWLKINNIEEKHICRSYADKYLCIRREYRKPTRDDKRVMNVIIALVERLGVTETCSPETPIGTNEVIIERYKHYVEIERGRSNKTFRNYLRHIRSFLTFHNGPIEDITVASVFAFIRYYSQTISSRQMFETAVALRSFLTFANYCGYISNNVAQAVPRVAQTHVNSIPRGISQEHLSSTLNSCDLRTDIGRRDYAILLLLARLGLRGGEIVNIELDDIDWRSGSLRVRGKGGYHTTLPLPYDVGEAIANYLKGRKRSNGSRALFLRSIAPARGLRNSVSICAIVGQAIKRAQIDAPRRGSHQFRHALATQMLKCGNSLPEIGQILRHANIQNTTIYAKVDITSLRSLALPWPGE